ETEFVDGAVQLLEDIQNALLKRQREFRDSHIRPCNSLDELKENFAGEGDADWLLCPWDGSPEQEEELAKSVRISIRCIPQGEMGVGPEAPCILTGRPTTRRVLWARSY
ncbi:MAG: proline--tRNA ligase, partial [Akkermansia sp.]|nr:proline--tRNA ligase [Akkermansia sp.]